MIGSEKDKNLLYQRHLLQLHQKGRFWLQILPPSLQTRIFQAKIICTLHPDIVTRITVKSIVKNGSMHVWGRPIKIPTMRRVNPTSWRQRKTGKSNVCENIEENLKVNRLFVVKGK